MRVALEKCTQHFGASCSCKKSITVPVVRGGRGKQEFWCVARVKVICNRASSDGGLSNAWFGLVLLQQKLQISAWSNK
jgi:hypothetical protein